MVSQLPKPVENLLSKLVGVRKTGNGWTQKSVEAWLNQQISQSVQNQKG